MAHVPLYLVIAAIGFVGVALAIVDPLIIAMLAVPGVLIVHRVGGASLNLSGSDVLTVAGVAAAFPLLRSDMRTTARLLGIAVAYQAITVIVVLAHPNAKDVFEWWHRLFLVGGSIVIGAALGRARRASATVSAFLVAATALAVAAIVTSLAHGFAPAYPFGYQKNFVGAMTASAVVIAMLRPAWLRISAGWSLCIALLCAAGLLASQSRGAMVALAAAILIAAVRQGRLSSRSIVAIAIVVPLVIFAVASFRQESSQHVQFNSLRYRSDYSALAYREWHLSPVVGQGFRFFERPGALLQTDAHNVIASTLAESGLVGLLALALLLLAATRAMWRLPVEVGTIAIALIVGRFVHGLFDVYWVAGSSTLPWLVVGMACGIADADPAVPEPSPAGPARRANVAH